MRGTLARTPSFRQLRWADVDVGNVTLISDDLSNGWRVRRQPLFPQNVLPEFLLATLEAYWRESAKGPRFA